MILIIFHASICEFQYCTYVLFSFISIEKYINFWNWTFEWTKHVVCTRKPRIFSFAVLDWPSEFYLFNNSLYFTKYFKWKNSLIINFFLLSLPTPHRILHSYLGSDFKKRCVDLYETSKNPKMNYSVFFLFISQILIRLKSYFLKSYGISTMK